MKLCLLSHFPPAGGGIASYARRIAAGLRQSGLDVSAVPLNGAADFLRLPGRLRRERPDAVRIEYSLAMYGLWSVWLLPVLWLTRRRLGFRLTACYHEPVRDMDRLGLVGRLYYRLISRLFDRVYVHTAEGRRVLVERTGMKAEKIGVYPLGTYDFPDRTDRRAELDTRFGLEDRRVVLFFGYIHIVKGIDHLIRAASLVFERRPELRGKLVFIVAGDVRRRRGIMRFFERGDQRYRCELLALCASLGLAGDVRFIGYVEEGLVYSLIARAEVVVVPYTTAEQSSLLVMAIPLGKPTVASDLGGHRELLQEVGGLVPVGRVDRYADEILALLEDPGRYAAVVAAYRAIAARDSTEAVTARLATDLRALVAAS